MTSPVDQTGAGPRAAADGLDFFGDLEELARPRRTFPSELAMLVAREHASAVVRRLLGRSRTQIETRSSGVVDLLERWVAEETADFSTCWNEEFSRAADLLQNAHDADIVDRSISLAVHLSSAGASGAWSARVESPRRYRWEQWLLPMTDRLSLRSDGAEATLVLANGATDLEIHFTRSDIGWAPEPSASVVLLPGVGRSQPPMLLLPAMAAGEPLAASVPPFEPEISPEAAGEWRDAIALLETYAPVYAPWTQRVVRQVGMVRTTPGVVHSGSYRHRHGFIHASARGGLMSIAEVLVHEASHQYFHLLSCLGAVDDGTDATQYYSPLVDTRRPLDRILFAFHACVNIRQLYRLCLANGISDDGYCERNMPIVARQIEQLAAPLSGNRALTAVGRTVYVPLVNDDA